MKQMKNLLFCWLWATVVLSQQQNTTTATATTTAKTTTSDSSNNLPRIVGGIDADPADYPYYGHSSPFFCGASLIHADIVVTAGHCQARLGNVEILFGGKFRTDPDVALDVVTVDGIPYGHPRFNANTYENDIAILKLRRSVRNTIPPVPWKTTSTMAVPTTGLGTAIGFGDTRYGGSLSDTLQQVTVPFVPFETCNSATYYNGKIYENIMLCAGEEGKDTCQGDSGGPLLDENGRLVGITSWGTGCALARRPGVYTNVAAYDLFLKQAICSLSDTNPLPSYCIGLPTGEGTFTRQNTTPPEDDVPPDDDTGRAFCEGGVFNCVADIIVWLFNFILQLFA